MFHADGCTDKKKVIVAFRNFTNAPKKSTKIKQRLYSLTLQKLRGK